MAICIPVNWFPVSPISPRGNSGIIFRFKTFLVMPIPVCFWKRLLWEARETYLEMSPLLWANRVNGALLMYHSMDDANVGTHPINAEHLFLALDGLGKPAALYMYPYEGHGPLAKETTLDQWARWVGWLDRYVMNPKK